MNEPVAQMPARASSTFVEKSLASLRMGEPDVCFSVEPISSTMVLKRIRSTSATIGSWPPDGHQRPRLLQQVPLRDRHRQPLASRVMRKLSASSRRTSSSGAR